MNARLTRSRTNCMLGGVCGGLGQYLGIDPTFVRIFFVLLFVMDGAGVLIYLLLWVLVPREDQIAADGSSTAPADFSGKMRQTGVEIGEAARRPNPKAGIYIGIALVVGGLLYLLEALNLPYMHWFTHELLWPVLIIAGGAVLLVRALRKGE